MRRSTCFQRIRNRKLFISAGCDWYFRRGRSSQEEQLRVLCHVFFRQWFRTLHLAVFTRHEHDFESSVIFGILGNGQSCRHRFQIVFHICSVVFACDNYRFVFFVVLGRCLNRVDNVVIPISFRLYIFVGRPWDEVIGHLIIWIQRAERVGNIRFVCTEFFAYDFFQSRFIILIRANQIDSARSERNHQYDSNSQKDCFFSA